MTILPFVFWGIMFCVGFLVGGLHSAVVCLLVGLSISLAFTIFNPVFVIVVGGIFGIAFLLAGLKVAFISLAVVAAAYVFLRLLG